MAVSPDPSDAARFEDPAEPSSKLPRATSDPPEAVAEAVTSAAGAAQSTAPTHFLGLVGDVRCSVTRVTSVFELDLDTLVITVGWSSGAGRFERELGSAVGQAVAAQIRNAATSIEPDSPISFSLPTQLPPALKTLVFATCNAPVTNSTTDSPSVDRARRAAAASMGRADAPRLGMPLLGAGHGLPALASADAVVASVRLALLDPPKNLTNVVFVATTDEEADAVRSAWGGYLPQRFANDRAEGPDLIGVRSEIEALADMLLLRDVEPPLALGVLGGWGTGKSFALHLLRNRVEEIRGEILTPNQCWDGPDLSPFVGHVYPIDFNAWTYARADLWAALMSRLFHELDAQLALEQLLKNSDDHLLNGALWRSMRAAPRELDALYRDAASGDLGTLDLASALTTIYRSETRQLEDEERELAKLRAAEASRAQSIENSVGKTLRRAVRYERWPVLRRIAANETKNLPAEYQDSVNSIVGALPQTRPAAMRNWFFVFLILAVPTAWIVGNVVQVDVLTRLGTRVTGALIIAGSLLKLVASWIEDARNITKQLDRWRQGAVEASKATDAELKVTRDQIASKEQKADRLRHRVGLVASFKSASDLVDARLDAGTYEERLGVMQLIQEDLRSLTDNLTVGDPTHDVYYADKISVFPRGPARVVLFIDDLDRCPPEKVVEVLEVVQLLLTTNLFIVVVALDVRYVTKALESVYSGVLEQNRDPSGLDYLQKIVQIPYRMRSLSPDGAKRFLRSQLRVVGTESPAVSPDSTSAANEAPAAPPSTEPLSSETTPAAIARQLDFSERELEVISACCGRLELSVRATKRIANLAKVFRLTWARQGRRTPTLDDMATLAMVLGLTAGHPEMLQQALPLALRHPADNDRVMTVLEKFNRDPSVNLALDGLFQQWKAALKALADEPVPGQPSLKFGAAQLPDVQDVIEFAAAFCFISDVQEPV